MAVITYSRQYPSYHPKAGQPTWFIEKLLKSFDSEELVKKIFDYRSDFAGLSYAKMQECDPKHHTVRVGRRWKAGMKFSPRYWGNDINPKSGRSGPYHSKQIILCGNVLITHTYDLLIYKAPQTLDKSGERSYIKFKGGTYDPQWLFDDHLEIIAKNDGLNLQDFKDWILTPVMKGKPFLVEAQIICWNKAVDYDNNPDWMPF